MAGLGLLFFNHIYAGLLSPEDAAQYIAGMILLGAAPCAAMVFVWSQLTKGDPNCTLVQVSISDVILIFAYAPLVGLLLGVTSLEVPWETLILSVALYVVIPLLAGVVTRSRLVARGGEAAVTAFTARLKPTSMAGLLLTVVLLFGFQGQVIFENPLLILLLAIPLIVQAYGTFALSYGWAGVWHVPHAQHRRGFETWPLDSSDFTNDPRSSIIDALSAMVINGTPVKIFAWFDNELGYACRLADITRTVAGSMSAASTR